MRTTRFKTWLTQGTYPRLYLPILVIMLTVIVVRYHFLLNSEVRESQARIVGDANRMGHFLVPSLLQQQSDVSAVQKMLEAEITFNPALESMMWQSGSTNVRAENPPPSLAGVPAWFVPLVRTERFDKHYEGVLPDGQRAVLTLTVRPNAATADIWQVASSQLGVSALNVATILVLLTLLLRANARMLNRLSAATVGFQSGRLDTRMEVKGTLEIQTVANTFNGMASQIEQLVTSLQETQCEQADQLHFTRQLVDSLPLPVFVRSARGICLVVNKAWEDMFGVRSEAVVGHPMPSNFGPIEDPVIDISATDHGGLSTRQAETIYEIYVRGQTRHVLYFKAPFTSRDGLHLGTIATLVDVTHREKDASSGLWSQTQSGLPSIH